jgi:hypothetical protein
MGVIQSSINNLLATAAIASKLTPGLEEKGKAREATNAVKKAEKVEAKVGADPKATPYEKAATIQATDKLVSTAVEKAQAAFESNPSLKAFNKVQEAELKQGNRQQNKEDFMREQEEEKARFEAEESSKTAAEAQLQASMGKSKKMLAEAMLRGEQDRVRESKY